MNIIPFNFDTFAVRSMLIEGEPWFVAGDVAHALGYRDAFNAVRSLDDDDKGTHQLSTRGGCQSVTVVNESGLYALILGSHLPSAKSFKRWVTKEVLPSIRRTGAFGISAQNDLALSTLRRIHADADREVERRTQHDFHRAGSSRAHEHVEAVIADVARKRGLEASAVALGFRRTVDDVMAEVYGDPVTQARIERQRAVVALEAPRRRMTRPRPRRRTVDPR